MDKVIAATIGSISARISGDPRYTTRIEVHVDDDGAHIVTLENAPAGGMDGPGGSEPFEERRRATVKPTARDIVKGIKDAIKADPEKVIQRWGKPTKRFYWAGIEGLGLELGLAQRALDRMVHINDD